MTKNRTIYITEIDIKRLKDLLMSSSAQAHERDREHLGELEEELRRGVIVPSEKIPGNVITMNSTVRLKDVKSGKEIVYTLVYPSDADVSQHKISVLAPIGTALLGFKVGDTITWKVPAGIKKLKVEEVLYQPEAAGNYHL